MHDSRLISLDPSSEPSPNEIDPETAPQETPGGAEAGFDPLSTCPPDLQPRFERRARLAKDQPLRAIELKCIDCSGWSRPEAARCEIASCPLYAMNRRLFGSP
jgi:hypothetical protein